MTTGDAPTPAAIPWRAVAHGVPVGLGVVDRDLVFVEVNERLARINRLPVDAHLGRTPMDLFPPEHGRAMCERFRDVLATGRATEGLDLSGPTADGTEIHVEASYFPVLADDGSVAGAACCIVDLTEVRREQLERRRAEERLRQLIDGLFSFVGLLDAEGTLLEANRTALEAAGLHPDDVLGRPFWEAYWWSWDARVQEELRRAVERGRRGEVSRYDVVVRVAEGRLITIDFQLVPLVEDGRVTAMVPSAIDVTDRLLETGQAEATARLARRLSVAGSTDDAVAAVLEDGPAALGADFVNLALVDDDSRTVRAVHPAHLSDDLTERYSVLDPDAATPLTDALRTGRAAELRADGAGVENGDGEGGGAGRYAAMVDDVRAAGLAVIRGVPLVDADGTPFGALGVGWGDRDGPDAEEAPRLGTVVELCAQTLQRTRLADVQRALVARLQSELLPVVPHIARLDVAVDYRPATTGLGFGGDWYDVVPLDADRTAVVVGDLAGHGIEAAARMAQVRGIVNALIEIGEDLSTVLARAAGPLARIDRGFLGTLLVAVVDTATHELRVVCAGHPPPVVRSPDGEVSVVEGGRGGVLGLPAGPVEPAVVAFPPGSTVVLYTDGLVERRTEPIDRGIARLAAALRSSGDASLDVARGLVGALVGGSTALDDDLALVVVTRRP